MRLERTGPAWSRVLQQDDPQAFVRRVMANRHVSLWRRLRRERLVAEPPQRVYADASPHVEDTMWIALGGLARRQRTVLELRYYEDLSEAEIARVLGCVPGTVQFRLSKGLRRCALRWATRRRHGRSRTRTAPDVA